MLTGQNDAEETKASVGPHTPEWGGGGGARVREGAEGGWLY